MVSMLPRVFVSRLTAHTQVFGPMHTWLDSLWSMYRPLLINVKRQIFSWGLGVVPFHTESSTEIVIVCKQTTYCNEAHKILLLWYQPSLNVFVFLLPVLWLADRKLRPHANSSQNFLAICSKLSLCLLDSLCICKCFSWYSGGFFLQISIKHSYTE